MQVRARRFSVLAGVLLAISLVGAPAVMAAEPSADDPVATVNGLLDTLVAKDFAGIAAFACADKRAIVAERFDLGKAFAALGEGVDPEALLAGMTVTMADRSVTLVARDGATATVAISGTLAMAVDEAVARDFVRQVFESTGQEVTDEQVDTYTALLMEEIGKGQDISDDGVELVLEDGVWLVCSDFSGVSTATPEPTLAPGETIPPMDPAAYAALLATIPEPLRASCKPDGYWQVPDLGNEPGEIAAADCDPDGYGGNYASFSLFDSSESMDAFYDQQLTGMTNLGALEGPGCPTGPGEATWDHGRRFCYQPFGDDANMRWTHDDLLIVGNAINDDGDWASLEAFFASAGPIAP